MDKKIWIPLALCSAVGAFLGIWQLTQVRQKPVTSEPETRSAVQILTGNLEPVISVVVPANELQLEVPLYSFVLQGQVIGEGLSWQERRENVLEKDESTLVNAETWEQQAQSRLTAVTLRYREHAAGGVEEDAALTERDRADSAVTHARQSLEHDMANRSLAAVGWGPVLAPVDGLLVPASPDGRVGIAADPSALCVRTIVDDTDTVRVSQKARIKIDGTDTEVAAKVTEIDVVPTSSAGRSGYAVTLSLDSRPATLPPGDADVHIYLEPLP